MSRRVSVIGVPTSAGAFAPGQEQAPGALRAAGLVRTLRSAGVEIGDRGDRGSFRWRPDKANRRAQNLAAVADIVRDTSRRVSHALGHGEVTLVLGGDCTVSIGTVAGHVQTGERVGLIYFDTHADLNVPASVRVGALDWMGLAHMLAVEGAMPELVDAGSRVPLLDPEHVVLFSWGSEQATEFERRMIDEKAMRTLGVEEVAADPEGAAARALALLDSGCDRLLVHFDVDAIDFTDLPLSENAGRNEGLPFDLALRALRRLLACPRLAGLTITELNPDHAHSVPGSIERFATSVGSALASGLATRETS